MKTTSTYFAEAAALERSYNQAVGEALELKVKVYYPGSGGKMKALGDLREDIARARKAREVNYSFPLGA